MSRGMIEGLKTGREEVQKKKRLRTKNKKKKKKKKRETGRRRRQQSVFVRLSSRDKRGFSAEAFHLSFPLPSLPLSSKPRGS